MHTVEPTPNGLRIQDINTNTGLFEKEKGKFELCEFLWGYDMIPDRYEYVDGIDDLIEITHYY